MILCEHSNSERNFLPVLARRFADEGVFGGEGETPEFVVSKEDRDPVQIV